MPQAREHVFPGPSDKDSVEFVLEYYKDLLLETTSSEALPEVVRLAMEIRKERYDLGEIGKKLSEKEKSKEKLHRKISALEQSARAKSRVIWKIEELLIVKVGIPDNLRKLRESLMEEMGRAISLDITIRRKEKIEANIEALTNKLQGQCPHQFVFRYEGYSGSASNDYDDQYKGRRVCVVCGLEENSKTSKADEYSTLVDQPWRLIKRDLHGLHGKKYRFGRPFSYQPMEFLLGLFEKSAGLMNLEWKEPEDNQKI